MIRGVISLIIKLLWVMLISSKKIGLMIKIRLILFKSEVLHINKISKIYDHSGFKNKCMPYRSQVMHTASLRLGDNRPLSCEVFSNHRNVLFIPFESVIEVDIYSQFSYSIKEGKIKMKPLKEDVRNLENEIKGNPEKLYKFVDNLEVIKPVKDMFTKELEGFSKKKEINKYYVEKTKSLHIMNKTTTKSKGSIELINPGVIKVGLLKKGVNLFFEKGEIYLNKSDRDYMLSITNVISNYKDDTAKSYFESVDKNKIFLRSKQILEGISGINNIKYNSKIETQKELVINILLYWMYLKNKG